MAMVKVDMSYHLGYNTLDEVYDCITKLRQARNSVVKSNYPTIDCKVNFAPGGKHTITAFWVTLRSEQPASLEQALKGYVTIAGTPNFIAAGSDYKLAEKVLSDFGKKLKGGWLDVFVGKRVEPLIASR